MANTLDYISFDVLLRKIADVYYGNSHPVAFVTLASCHGASLEAVKEIISEFEFQHDVMMPFPLKNEVISRMRRKLAGGNNYYN